MPDWKWLIALAVAAVLARVVQLGRELDTLKARFNALKLDDNVNFPSDDSDAAKEIKIAKALYKAAGQNFTWAHAKMVGKRAAEKKAKETTGGSNDKKTA